MESTTVDRRVLKTKRQLRQGLAVLMKQKKINRISVKELCDLVDINRATFYAHYKDIYDLVEEIETEVVRQFQEMLESHSLESAQLDVRPLLTEIFCMVGASAELASALLGRHGDIAFLQRIQAMVGDYFIFYWQKFKPEDHSLAGHYSYVFVVSGCTGLIQRWLEEGMPQTPEEMADIAARLVRSGLLNFLSES